VVSSPATPIKPELEVSQCVISNDIGEIKSQLDQNLMYIEELREKSHYAESVI